MIVLKKKKRREELGTDKDGRQSEGQRVNKTNSMW